MTDWAVIPDTLRWGDPGILTFDGNHYNVSPDIWNGYARIRAMAYPLEEIEARDRAEQARHASRTRNRAARAARRAHR